MPRPVNWPPRIRTKRGRAFIRVGGRDYYLGGPPDSPEARAEYARLLGVLAESATRNVAAATPNVAPTVEAVILAFWEHAEQTYSARGRELDQFRVSLRPLRRLYGPTLASDFRVAQLERLQLAMADGSWMTDAEKAEATRRKRPVAWCRNVVHRRIGRVLTMFRWAERQGLLPEGRHAHLLTRAPLPRSERIRQTIPRQPCTLEQVEGACAHAPAPVAAMLRLQWLTGMRSGEVRILRACDVDRSGDVWLYRPSAHKCQHLGHSRVVAIGPEAQAVLTPWLVDGSLTGGRAARKNVGNSGPGQVDGILTGYLFPSGRRGKSGCYTPFSYAQAVRRACAAAGVVPFSPYQCRHAARQRFGVECGDNVARQLLGQVSLESTSHYARRQDVAAAVEAARRVG